MNAINTQREKILANHDPRVRRRAELEYDVINAVITHCTRAGFKLDSIAWMSTPRSAAAAPRSS